MALALLLALGQLASGLFPDGPRTEGDVALEVQVERLMEHPIDLNRATPEDLLGIPWLNPLLVYRIVSRRDSLGGFSSVAQLADVTGMTPELLESVRGLVTVARAKTRWQAALLSRVGVDSIGTGTGRFRLFNRARLETGRVTGVLLTERDAGEASIVDFVGGGVQVSGSRVRLTAGDYTCGAGQGLVLCAASWRSSLLNGPDWRAQHLRLLTSASEGSHLRGAAAELMLADWRLGVLGSYAGRDARLNPDGTVERLLGSGVHDDSASIAGRRAAREATAGAVLDRRVGAAVLGLAAAWSGYDRAFVPRNTSTSFSGRQLAALGVNAGVRLSHYLVGLEFAGSTGRGVAGALTVAGQWPDFDARASIRGHQQSFYAPHSRWTTLTSTENRLDASGSLGWHHAGSRVTLAGNTYRDFDMDSMPARLELKLGQDLGRLRLGLVTGARYEAAQQRHRTTRLETDFEPGAGVNLRLALADVYPEHSAARGRMAALSASGIRVEAGSVSIEPELTGAVFALSGTGVTMYLREPGPTGLGASYSTSASTWRLSAALRFGLGPWLRVGVRTGLEWRHGPALDLAGQVELKTR